MTIEDVIEEIVGNVPGDDETAPSGMTSLADGSWLVDGHAPLDQVERILGISLAKPLEYTTVAGLLLDTLQAVPQRGASVVIAGRRWTVVEIDGPRIRRVKVEAG